MKKFIFALLILLSVACIPGRTAEQEALDTLQRTQNAITINEYRKRLIECKNKGKEAKSLDIYERCAEQVDKEYGVVPSTDGGSNG